MSSLLSIKSENLLLHALDTVSVCVLYKELWSRGVYMEDEIKGEKSQSCFCSQLSQITLFMVVPSAANQMTLGNLLRCSPSLHVWHSCHGDEGQ